MIEITSANIIDARTVAMILRDHGATFVTEEVDAQDASRVGYDRFDRHKVLRWLAANGYAG